VGVRGSGQEARSRTSDDVTALSPAATDMRSVLAAGSMQRVVFGSDWPFSALTLTGSGDPQPELDQSFTTAERLQVERANALRELPRLAQAVGG
jgi:predicted TIM-barrel fold metal-dependent hydrolase